MLTFITSFRARALSRHWEHHVWLLERTLDSILAQTSPEFNVAVVCHDVPDIPQVRHAAVTVLPVDFPPPERSFNDMSVDKTLKITRGVDWAQSHGSDHVMFVDADDLVSRRLAEFAAAHKKENGWYVTHGFEHHYGNPWLRALENHHLICGTCGIVRADLLDFDRIEFYRNQRVVRLAAAGHGNYAQFLANRGTPIRPLPFAGAVYVLHGDSMCEAPGGTKDVTAAVTSRPLWRRALSRGKRTAKTIPLMRFLTPRLRREFSVPLAARVPAEFRAGGARAG